MVCKPAVQQGFSALASLATCSVRASLRMELFVQALHCVCCCAAGLEPSSAQQEAAGEQASASTADQQELLEQLHEQLQHLIDERQDDLRAAFKELGLPEPELRLDVDGDDGSSSSSRPRQLTGR